MLKSPKILLAMSLVAFTAACGGGTPEEEVVYVEPEQPEQPAVQAEPTYNKY